MKNKKGENLNSVFSNCSDALKATITGHNQEYNREGQRQEDQQDFLMDVGN